MMKKSESKSEENENQSEGENEILESSMIINDDENSFFDLRSKKGQFLFLIITITTSVLITHFLKSTTTNFEYKLPSCNESNVINEQNVSRPKYFIYGKGGDGQWVHVMKILNLFGMQRVSEDESDKADLWWAHDYPFNTLKNKISAMQSHQKLNHLPGCGFLTNKIDLSTSNMKYIPKAFKLPKDEVTLRKYAENTEKQFVVKHHQHRHIKIQKLEDINFNDNETFVQEFIPNPLLVDGHKFDIGVYTIITSIDPLRIYIYYGDILFRYCAKKYYPFDPLNVDQYVVGDDYLPVWNIPSLSRYYNALGYGMRGSFDAYMKTQGRDPQIIWDQVEDAIRVAILTKHPFIKNLLQRYKNKQNFFEMMRFDLIIDDDLNVHLIEANFSPNLSSAHFKQNSILYEQVIYHTLNLVGIGSYLYRENFKKLNSSIEAIQSSDKNVMVNGQVCTQLPCSESCSPVECSLCKPCLSKSDIAELHRAYREHLNKGDTKRIFPIPIRDKNKPLEDDFYKTLSPENQLITKWFHAKCLENFSWCS